MINLKNLKSIFIVEEDGSLTQKVQQGDEKIAQKMKKAKAKQKASTSEVPVGKKKATKAKAPTVKTKRPGATKAEPKAPNPRTGAVDKRYLQKLIEAIEANNIDGFDYLEFKNSIKALNHLPLDEATKFKTAFATASTMGLTKEKLIKSATFYQTVIDKEKDKFRTALQGQVNSKILAKEREREQLSNAIHQKSEMIKQLTAEINQHQENLSQIEGQIGEIKDKIEATKDGFLTAYDFLTQQISQDQNKIQEHLG